MNKNSKVYPDVHNLPQNHDLGARLTLSVSILIIPLLMMSLLSERKLWYIELQSFGGCIELAPNRKRCLTKIMIGSAMILLLGGPHQL